MKKTHWKKLDNPNYLGCYSLMDGEKHEVNLTINKVVVENFRGDTENGKVVYFKEKKVGDIIVKPMILNHTNSLRIEKLSSSPYVEDWEGLKVCIYIANFQAFGSMTDGLRIKEPPKKPTLDKERFKKAIELIKTGKQPIKVLNNYELTKEQKDESAKL